MAPGTSVPVPGGPFGSGPVPFGGGAGRTTYATKQFTIPEIPGGRTDQPLISGRPLPIGCYEIRFAVGDHFRRRGIEAGDPPFLDIVPLRFSVAEPEGHYHVPLLCSPWSYSTYRGS